MRTIPPPNQKYKWPTPTDNIPTFLETPLPKINEKNSFFKRRHRIVTRLDSFIVEVKYWWCPFWINVGDRSFKDVGLCTFCGNSHTSIEACYKFIERGYRSYDIDNNPHAKYTREI